MSVDRRRRRLLVLASVALSLLVLAAACGGRSSGDSAAAAETATRAAVEASSPEWAEPSVAPVETAALPPASTPMPALAPSQVKRVPDGPVSPQIPFPSPRPSSTPAPSPTRVSASPPGRIALTRVIPRPPDRDLVDLARRLKGRVVNADELSRATPVRQVSEGDRERFWVIRNSGGVQINAVARRVSEHAYWFFDDRFDVEEGALDRAAKEFEEKIWPTVTGLFGDIWTPGVDGDPRLTILHTRLMSGTSGYYSAADEYPDSIREFSNEREIIYLDAENLEVGSRAYLAALAHELQHASHWAADPNEDTWLNEGMSELAVERAGFYAPSARAFLRQPDAQLTSWPDDINAAGPNYGGALLFLDYLVGHYGGDKAIGALVRQPLDGMESVDAVLAELGFKENALDVFRDWLVANYLDEPGGRYGYPDRSLPPAASALTLGEGTVEGSVNQFAADYHVARLNSASVRIRFQGSPEARLFPVEPDSGGACWWSNVGDAIDTTLTRRLDLRRVDAATLRFSLWYDIEEDWDYAYVEASADDGATWTILPGGHATTRNPNGTGYGPGYSGTTAGWVEEEVDLSPFAGREVLLRFEYVTDDAVNEQGLCLDSFEVPELGWRDDAETDGGWDANGFIRTGGRVPQEYIVQVVLKPDSGPAEVRQLPVGADGRGEIVLRDVEPGKGVTVIVSAVAPASSTPARYALTFESG